MSNDETYRASDGFVCENEYALKKHEEYLKEVRDAVDTIADYCRQRSKCDGCLFDFEPGCMFNELGEPSNW